MHSGAGFVAGGRRLGPRGGGVGARDGGVAAGDLEAGASEARGISAMDDNGTVAKEAGGARGGGGVEFQVAVAQVHVSCRPYS